MKKRDVERALRGMAAQETPEVLGQILRTLGKEQSMELTLKKDPVIRMPDEQERAARRGGRTGGRMMVKRMGALAAAVALVLAFGAAYLQFSVDSVIDIDVNPSVEIRINRGEKVLSATALNEDAETVLRGMDLKNVDLNVAVNAIIGSMLKNGYLTSAGNAICVSVENENAARGEALGQKLTEEINSLLEGSSVTGRVLTRTLEENADLAELARANGISAGKAALAQLAVEQSGGSLTFEAAAALSVRELWAAAYPEDAVFLSLDDARAAALEAAGLQADETVFAAGHLYRKEERYVYELKLLTADAKYDCLVDALDGQVLELSHDPLGQNTLPAPGSVIGGEEALAAACADAGIRTAAATVTKCKLDTDDGRWIYEIEFRAGGMEYEHEIDARSGAVLERESDPEKSAQDTAGVIGQEKAMAAACADAGVQVSGVTLKKCEMDTDDGRQVYEIEFKV
ncbi:MAG: PepSY domain-containing protein, partial [Clostridia bacterium]|nr:PepSY domain-containing protein [Clostridia bacterium]